MEVNFVRRSRARDEQVARADLPRHPGAAHVPFAELGHAAQIAGNVRFRGGWNEKAIDDARKPPAPGKKPRPLERHAIGHHFASEIPGESGGSAAIGCLHSRN